MAKQKEAWDKLSMLEKALLIKLSVDNGVSSLKLIRDTYNLYSSGGDLAHKYDGMSSNNLNLKYVATDASLPNWGHVPGGTSWDNGVHGINGVRYLRYPKLNFYVNDDGSVRAYGLDSIPVVERFGNKYIEIEATSPKSAFTYYDAYNTG